MRIAFLRYPFIAASVVVAAAATVTQWYGWVTLLPWHPAAWAVWPIACVGLLGLLIASEIQRDFERQFVTELHRQDLHKEAARVWDVIARDEDYAPSTTALGKSFAAHFQQTGQLMRQWHASCEERSQAATAVDEQIAKEAPTLKDLVYNIMSGAYKLDEMKWSLHEEQPGGRVQVELRLPQSVQMSFTPVHQNRAGAEEQLERLSSIVKSVPKWPSVIRRAAAVESCRTIRQKLLDGLYSIQKSYEIRRARNCVLCRPHEG
jgi:hypothetical protein